MSPTNTVMMAKLTAALAAAQAADSDGETIAQAMPEPEQPVRNVTRRGAQAKLDAAKAAREGTDALTWAQDLFGTLATSVVEGTIGVVEQTGPIMYAPLTLKGQPNQLTVQMDLTDMPAAAIAYHVTDGNVCNLITGNIADLVIPVYWKNDKPAFAEGQTRVMDSDNCDVVIVTEKGQTVQMQISVSLRVNRKDYEMNLQVQEVDAEQLVRTRGKLDGLTCHSLGGGYYLTAIPLWQHQAHPQKDWLGMANVKDFFPAVMLEEIIDTGRSVPLSKASRVDWTMPELWEYPEEGTMDGVVLWYNAIWGGGGGFMLGADGKSYKIHWSQVKGAHVVQPGSVYRFTPGEHENPNNGRKTKQANKIQAG